ncbi:hypothetical protein, partial [Nocardia seriolae]|uniref:hypothetical protein n=1 Tax=Nocardia seriolae TaxID=37332 RepID=UPI001E4E0C7F
TELRIVFASLLRHLAFPLQSGLHDMRGVAQGCRARTGSDTVREVIVVLTDVVDYDGRTAPALVDSRPEETVWSLQ